ncbi:MAG: hypothetical protein ACWGO1_10045 [Anaerolineales bacterium]
MTNKLSLALFTAVLALSISAGGALAAGALVTGRSDGAFVGTFTGNVYGDRGSHAPITLELTQTGKSVSAEMELGEGLYVDGGICGGSYLPASVQSASGETLSTDPRQLQAATAFSVSGLKISAELDGTISPDGKDITAEVNVDLPWLCGRDPVLKVELSKIQ